jgi:hypothetical protein
MAKKVLKKKTNTFIRDCLIITEKNQDLDNLFSNLDNILDYNLSNRTNLDDLSNSISVLGGKEFASVTIYLLSRGNYLEAIDNLIKENVDERLIQKYKFIMSKYANIVYKQLSQLNNEYGWDRVKVYNLEIKSSWELGIELLLNNGSQIIIRDEPESIAELVENIVIGLISLKKYTKIDQKVLDSLKEQVDILVYDKPENE